jgi:hypothetical protein
MHCNGIGNHRLAGRQILHKFFQFRLLTIHFGETIEEKRKNQELILEKAFCVVVSHTAANSNGALMQNCEYVAYFLIDVCFFLTSSTHTGPHLYETLQTIVIVYFHSIRRLLHCLSFFVAAIISMCRVRRRLKRRVSVLYPLAFIFFKLTYNLASYVQLNFPILEDGSRCVYCTCCRSLSYLHCQNIVMHSSSHRRKLGFVEIRKP